MLVELTLEGFPQLSPYGSGKDFKEEQPYSNPLMKKGETGNLFSRKTYVSYMFDVLFHLTFTATLEICAVISSFLLLEGNKTRGYEEKLEQGLGSENKSV